MAGDQDGGARVRRTAGAGLTLTAALGAGGTAEAATFTVTNLSDTGPGSLRQALAGANATAVSDTVLFQSGLSGTITVASQIPVTQPVEIVGPGADRLAISGNDSTGIMDINLPLPSSPIIISGLTFKDGNNLTGPGGALRVPQATLTLSHSVVTGSRTPGSGGGIWIDYGLLTLISSTISNNQAGRAGGISAYSGPTIVNSTIAGNTATDFGGGGVAVLVSSVNVTSSTIAGNHAATTGGGLQGGGGGGAGDPNTLEGTVIADNTAAVSSPDVEGFFDVAFSLIENTSGAMLTSKPAGSNVFGADPRLDALGDNGGPTETVKLRAGSPAINTGAGDASATDQRGAPRSGRPDIGAYERVRCAGKLVNRVGTDDRDRLRGTRRADGLLALGGPDRLLGRGGGDGLCGGPGRDKLLGGKGRDRLLGGKGRDLLRGGPGRDRLRGGPSPDRQIQ